jgi:glutathione S-transferase/transposase
MTVMTMSRRELTRLRVLIDVADGRLSVADATGLIGVSRRQIYRLLDAFRARGADGLISRKRGRPSNRALGAVFRQTVVSIVRERYADFGPTLAAEKLSELHGLDLGVETLRQWMITADIWVRRKDRLKRIHQPRARRDCLGELVQIDGSEHWWFEDRGPQCTLLVYVDDATSRLMHLKFVETESTFDYFQATREYLEAHGKPVAFYSDKHGVFRVNSTGAVEGDGMTQFGRSLHALNIDILCANTPQAKGRVERANKTFQDRLVNELRVGHRLRGEPASCGQNNSPCRWTPSIEWSSIFTHDMAPLTEFGASVAADSDAPIEWSELSASFVSDSFLPLEIIATSLEFAAMKPGTLKQEPHLSRHPFGRIPAFEHDGWMLYEARAIMRYVDAVVPQPRPLQPSDPRALARMEQVMNITDWYVMQQISRTITFGRVVAPRFGMPVDEHKIAQAVPDAHHCIAEVARLLDAQPYMAGDAVSLADLLLAPHLSMLSLAPEGAEILGAHSNLGGWLGRMEARPSMQATTWDRLLERAAQAAAA